MKKLFVGLFFLCLALCNTAKAQTESTEKKNIAKLGIPNFVFGSFLVSYERVITEKITGQMNFFFFGRKTNPSPWGPNGGWGITPEARFYLTETKQSPLGFFLAPFLTLQGLRYDYSISKDNNPQLYDGNGNLNAGVKAEAGAKSTVFGIGATVGYQWLFRDIITLDVYAGPGFGLSSMKTDGGDATHTPEVIRKEIDAYFPFTKQNGLIFRAGVSVGVIF